MPILTVCSSAQFYKQVVELVPKLEQIGFEVIIPSNARKMAESNDFDVSHYRTWLTNADDYPKKAALMREHFDEVAKADAILVINNEKHSVANYIGGNVLMEMAIAFYLKKPIYIFNDIPSESTFLEEILGMQPIVLSGDIKKMNI